MCLPVRPSRRPGSPSGWLWRRRRLPERGCQGGPPWPRTQLAQARARPRRRPQAAGVGTRWTWRPLQTQWCARASCATGRRRGRPTSGGEPPEQQRRRHRRPRWIRNHPWSTAALVPPDLHAWDSTCRGSLGPLSFSFGACRPLRSVLDEFPRFVLWGTSAVVSLWLRARGQPLEKGYRGQGAARQRHCVDLHQEHGYPMPSRARRRGFTSREREEGRAGMKERFGPVGLRANLYKVALSYPELGQLRGGGVAKAPRRRRPWRRPRRLRRWPRRVARSPRRQPLRDSRDGGTVLGGALASTVCTTVPVVPRPLGGLPRQRPPCTVGGADECYARAAAMSCGPSLSCYCTVLER